MTRNKRLTFANDRKETSTSGKDKFNVGIMESVGLAAIIQVVEKSGLIDLLKYYNIELPKNHCRFLMQMVPFEKSKKVS